MASKLVKSINRTYKTRYVKKSQKGAGTYAHGLPGTAQGLHDARNACRCGRCSA